jgi:SAM-dependent methyltransferase
MHPKVIRSIKKFFPIVSAMRNLNRLIRKLSLQSHRLQRYIEWIIDNPEYFDHQMDINYQWHASRFSYPMERGVFSSFALMGVNGKIKGKTLDLCSGDGFYSYYFYSARSVSTLGIDFDEQAIRWSRKNYQASGLMYQLGDIRFDIPSEKFDNIVWDAAIEHFTESEINSLMLKIKSSLVLGGILSGYTITKKNHNSKHLHQHEYEFHDKADLARFLKPHFKNVQIFETYYSDRTNLYFYATDGLLPFDRETVLTLRG